MIKIAALWDYSWNVPMMEMDQWTVILREFDVERLYMTPISGIKNDYVTERASLQEIIDENPDYQVVFLSEVGTQDLTTFEHPEKVLYIFGRTNYSPFNDLAKEGDISVKIDTSADLGMLLSHQAAAITLYDRLIKWRSQ